MTAYRCLCVALFLMLVTLDNISAQTPGRSPASDARCVVDPAWPQKPDSFTWGAMSGVNVTLGLPIVRTSVDHGTAFGKAGEGRANPQSMLDAIRLAALLAP